MKKFFLFLASFILLSSLSLLFAPNAFAEDISFTRVFDQYNDLTINYSNFSNGTCYIFRIGLINADGSRTWQPNAQGSSPQSCWREAITFYASETLGQQGTLTLPTSSLNYGDYELELNKRICQQPGNWGCISYNLEKDQFTIRFFESSCTVTVTPTSGFVDSTNFSVTVFPANFISTISQITFKGINIDTGSVEPTIATLYSGTSGQAASIGFSVTTPGNYKFQIWAPKTPGAADEMICESSPFTVDTNSLLPTPTPFTCAPPNPTTGQCPDSPCHLTGPNTCEIPFLALPSPVPTITPTPFPTIPAFNPANCPVGPDKAKCDACVGDPTKPPQGVWTGVGCIKTDPAGFVRSLFGIILGLAGGIALIIIIYSGYRMIASTGNPEAIQGARETLTAAIVGLLFIVFSFVILEIIGVDILHLPGFSP